MSTTNAVRRALAINEIIALILGYVADNGLNSNSTPSLGPCILVNQQFHQEAIRIQWRTITSIYPLILLLPEESLIFHPPKSGVTVGLTFQRSIPLLLNFPSPVYYPGPSHDQRPRMVSL